MTHRGYCFTLNNYTDADVDRISAWNTDPDILDATVGRETAPSTGTPHLQGFVVYAAPRTHAWARRHIGSGAHVEPSRAHDASRRYCAKDGNLILDKKTVKMQGRRTDLEQLITALQSGGLYKAKQDCPDLLIRFHAGARAYMTIQPPSIDRSVAVYVFVGPTGTGKSRAANERQPLFRAPIGRRLDPVWFDGYIGQPHLVLDDFYGSWPWDLLLRICDRYATDVPVKGGFVPAAWTTVTITSNDPPEHWYPDKMIAPFLDRIQRGNGAYIEHPKTFKYN